MSFEDFLDMASVLSEEAPAELKADWAFRVFGNFFHQLHFSSLEFRHILLKLLVFMVSATEENG